MEKSTLHSRRRYWRRFVLSDTHKPLLPLCPLSHLGGQLNWKLFWLRFKAVNLFLVTETGSVEGGMAAAAPLPSRSGSVAKAGRKNRDNGTCGKYKRKT